LVAANDLLRLADEIRQLAVDIERSRATAARLPALPPMEDAAKARREYRRALAGRHGCRERSLPRGFVAGARRYAKIGGMSPTIRHRRGRMPAKSTGSAGSIDFFNRKEFDHELQKQNFAKKPRRMDKILRVERHAARTRTVLRQLPHGTFRACGEGVCRQTEGAEPKRDLPTAARRR
jgi:hypothetical protein